MPQVISCEGRLGQACCRKEAKLCQLCLGAARRRDPACVPWLPATLSQL